VSRKNSRNRPAPGRRGVHRPYARVPVDGEIPVAEGDPDQLARQLLSQLDDGDPLRGLAEEYIGLDPDRRRQMVLTMLSWTTAVSSRLHPQLAAMNAHMDAHKPQEVDQESLIGRQIFGLMDWSHQADITDVIAMHQYLAMAIGLAAALDFDVPEEFADSKHDMQVWLLGLAGRG